VVISSILGRIAVPVAIAVVFSLARRFMPPPRSETITFEDARRFSRLQWLIGGIMIVVAILVGLASYEAFVWMNRTLASRDGVSEFLLLPNHWIWFFFSFFGAICLTWELTLCLWILLGDRSQAQKYETWSNDKTGFNATRVLRLMIFVIALPIGLATLLALPIHTSLSETGLRIGHFGTLTPRYHPYSEVRGITVTQGLRLRDGTLQNRPAIVLDFADGDRWSSADNRDPQRGIDPRMLNFLQGKTNLPVRYLDAYPFGAN
jgi:hypothetical protein